MPWETAIDRRLCRSVHAEEADLADEAITNVAVVIRQHGSFFSGWWAQAEERCSVGLAGRFVFSFGAAGEPGPPDLATLHRPAVGQEPIAFFEYCSSTSVHMRRCRATAPCCAGNAAVRRPMQCTTTG